jgi:hypothetical protein
LKYAKDYSDRFGDRFSHQPRSDGLWRRYDHQCDNASCNRRGRADYADTNAAANHIWDR